MCCYKFLLRLSVFYQLCYIIFFGVHTNYTKYNVLVSYGTLRHYGNFLDSC